jgi:hypothetical protein
VLEAWPRLTQQIQYAIFTLIRATRQGRSPDDA